MMRSGRGARRTLTRSPACSGKPDWPSNVTIRLSANSINENDAVTLSGTFYDAYDYLIGNHTVTINWGDGSLNTVVSVPGGNGTFNIPTGVTHQYLDDNPTGTSSDNYTISVTLSDDDRPLGRMGRGERGGFADRQARSPAEIASPFDRRNRNRRSDRSSVAGRRA